MKTQTWIMVQQAEKTYQILRPRDTFSNASNHAVYNLYGIKVADNSADMNTLPPGIYILNGKKIVIK